MKRRQQQKKEKSGEENFRVLFLQKRDIKRYSTSYHTKYYITALNMSFKHTILSTFTLLAVIHHFTASSSTTNSQSRTVVPSVMAYQTVTRSMRTLIRTINTKNTNNKYIADKSTGVYGAENWKQHNNHRHLLLLENRVPVTTSRLYSSSSSSRNPKRGGDDDDDDDNKIVGKVQKWLSKAANKVKSILPSSWTSSGTKEDASIRKSRQYQQQQQQREEMSSSLDTLFKDSPLGIRLMGNMIIKPIISSLAGSLAQTMQEQQREISDLLEEARTLILYDKNLVTSLGGEPIQVSHPFSQSSSSSSVSLSSGRMEKRSRVEASFQVTGGGRGSYASGVATMVAVNGAMERLYVNVQGRYYEVNVVGKTAEASSTVVVDDIFTSSRKDQGTTTNSNTGTFGKNHKQGGGKDDIIDAEFVDKKVYKR